MKALTIRRLRPSDAEALYRILSDRQVMRYLEPPYDRLQTEQFLREAGLAEPPLVYGTEEDGRLLGYVITTPMTRTAWSWAGCSPRTAGGRAMRPG